MRKEIHKKKVGELLHRIAEIEINLDIKKIENKKLEEEIKKLKEERDNFMLKYSKAVEEKIVETNKLCTERNKLEEENKKLKSDLSLVIKERDDNIEQNKKLKSDLAFKNTMLDNVKAEYESSLNIIRKLNKRIKELEQCNLNLQTWLDNKEKVNKSMREELQRYKDMWDSGEF